MRRKLPWIALALGAYLAFLISQFPAETAIRWLAPEQFRAIGISGTIWRGSAALASIGRLPVRELRWQISGPSLLIGRLSGDLSARLSSGFVEGRYSLSPGSVTFRQLQVSTSLDAMADLLPLMGTRAQVSVDLDLLILEDEWPTEIVGTLRISGLEVEPFLGAGNRMIVLGNYQVTFNEDPSPVLTGLVRDTGGPLELNGAISLFPNREYDLAGQLLARPEAQPELIQGLSIMLPEPDADGRRAFSFPGSL